MTEFAGRQETTTEGDERVGRDGGDTGGGDEGRERHGGGQNGTEKECSDCPDDFDGVTG